MAQHYRYPGAKPFLTSERHIFYGRQEDVTELYDLLLVEPVVVLHSKSGMGKSSLINAGLIPRVEYEREYNISKIRFFANGSGNGISPLQTTSKILNGKSELLDKIKPKGENSLWYHLKSLQLDLPAEQGILLIFDQFEELFTYEADQVKKFARELSEALYTTLPQRFREKRKKAFLINNEYLSPDELSQLDQPLKLRILLSIRSDRMSLLKNIKDYLPNLISIDYQLKPLNQTQAEDAILSPAYQNNGFSTPPFDFEDDAIEYLLSFLSNDGQENIESFQLQILCEYVEQKIVQKENKVLISKSDISNPEQILENYYHDKISAITDPVDQMAVRRFIEEGLIFEEENRRLTVYEGQIQKSYGISSDLLRQLLNTHLLRSEPSMRGGYTYELSHDTLVSPVLKAKTKRLKEERRLKEEKERLEKEKETAELRAKAEKESKRAEEQERMRYTAESNEQKAMKRTRIAVILSIIGIGLAIFAGFQFNNSKNVLAELAIVNTKTVARLLPEIDQHILDLDYGLVPEKAIAALAYDGDKQKIARNIQETSYFYMESKQFEKAGEALAIMDIVVPNDLDKASLLPLIQQMDTANFKILGKRYYPVMVPVKGGTFTMGCEKGTNCQDDELPLHKVSVDDFEIATTETTWWQFALYCASVGKNVEDFTPAEGNTPVVNVEWYDAVEYSNWLSKRKEETPAYNIESSKIDPTNLDDKNDPKRWLVERIDNASGYRLPTEAEWEYAAKGGINLDTFLYSGSEIADSVGWFKGNAKNKIQAVGNKLPNQLGVYDMSGNVWEWCWDWKYEEDIDGKGNYQEFNKYFKKFENTIAINPPGAKNGIRRVLRGNAFNDVLNYLRISNRSRYNPFLKAHIIGFRCVKGS